MVSLSSALMGLPFQARLANSVSNARTAAVLFPLVLQTAGIIAISMLSEHVHIPVDKTSDEELKSYLNAFKDLSVEEPS